MQLWGGLPAAVVPGDPAPQEAPAGTASPLCRGRGSAAAGDGRSGSGRITC